MTTKNKIIVAANAVVAREGASNLTLDAVAAEAGISKGGLLYHFPNKRALLNGMLNSLVQQTKDDIDIKQSSPKHNGSFISAFIAAQSASRPAERAASLALLAAAAEDPSLLAPVNAHLQDWMTSAQQESEMAEILLLAAHGIRFMDVLNLLSERTGSADQLYDRLLKFSEPKQ